ncbi:hypothetical protein MVEN_00291200 [Mycena venus]|uniref:C2H2-type domain-containing protein n=1 Tax=Mycena venus TaxID=2733690 RepID=A0A8H6Z5F3_9AGAR|nr:hypothetical protein MVEN_00291200 [Mycena venus]
MTSSSSRRKIPPTLTIPPAEQTHATEAPPLHKPFICNDCEKAFATSGHLTRHQRVHSGKMNYACSFPGCTTHCSRKDNLRQHYRLHFDIRDTDELQQMAPEKRRRKTRVTRVATVNIPAPSNSTDRQPITSASDNSSRPSREHTPTPAHHSPSPSSSSNESASYSPYEQYPQEHLRTLPQQRAWTSSSSPNVPQHPPRSGNISSEGSFPSPYGPLYPQHAYGHPSSYAQVMSPPMEILANAPAFSRPRHTAPYLPMSSSRRYSQPTLTHAPTPSRHSPSASSSSGESSFFSMSERYLQEPFHALSLRHAQSARPPTSLPVSPSQSTIFRSSYAQPYVPVAYPPQAQAASPPVDTLGGAQPLSPSVPGATYSQSHERSAMPSQPPWTYDCSE